jgi:transcriptional regulator with XRE-family HTH domain
LSSIGETISAIRQRMGKTMVEFARLVGSDHSSVSRYESGQIVPGKTMLILLLLLAQGDEKTPLLKTLGLRDDAETQQAFEGALESLVEYERLATRSGSRSAKDAGLAEFVKEAAAIAAARLSLDPVVADILRLLRTSKASPKIQTHFRRFMVYLDVALAESSASVASKGHERRRSKNSVK